MTKKTNTPSAPILPLAGGDYVQRDGALKQVVPSTAPPPGKRAKASEAAERAASVVPAATPSTSK